MPVWGPISVFSEVAAAFLSQTATRVILNHHQINYLCSLSPAFPFYPGLPLHLPLCESHVLWISNQLLQFGRGHPWSAGREIRDPVGQSPKLQGVQGKRLPRGCFRKLGQGHAHRSQPLWRCRSCASVSVSWRKASDKVTPHLSLLQMWFGGKEPTSFSRPYLICIFGGWAEHFQCKDLGQNDSGRDVQ